MQSDCNEICNKKKEGLCRIAIEVMPMKNKAAINPKVEGRFVGADEIAARWSVSRSTAVRILEQVQLPCLYLSGMKRGVRRWNLDDVVRYEQALLT